MFALLYGNSEGAGIRDECVGRSIVPQVGMNILSDTDKKETSLCALESSYCGMVGSK